MTGKGRKTINRLTWYDDPDRIWLKMISGPGWNYKDRRTRLEIRDLALMSVLYISCARISEILGGTSQVSYTDQINGKKRINYIEIPPIKKDQFVEDDKYIWLRHIPVIKQKFTKKGGRWQIIEELRDYPIRVDIPFFKEEKPLNKFTNCLKDHLDFIYPGEPVFKIGARRAWEICKYRDPDFFPHYFRDMGLKFWHRYFKQDAFKLKRFSGHKRWNSLEKYMKEELF